MDLYTRMLTSNWRLGSALSIVTGIMAGVWLLSVGNPVDYLTYTVPPGQLLYILSKLVGLVAFGLFWLQCLFGLSSGTSAATYLPRLKRGGHRLLGFVIAGLVILHFLLFFAAASIRAEAPAWNLLLPNFSEGYYNFHVGLGVVSFWIMAIAIYAGWQSARGRRAWRSVHMLWPIVFGLAFWHAFGIGSESRLGMMRYVWLFIGTSLVIAGFYRVGDIWRRIRFDQANKVATSSADESQNMALNNVLVSEERKGI